jgi:heat-inducible transcriptional repressor
MTERQKQLLAAIIKEFIETAEAVGSVSLNDKYRFNVSSATIRNEMAELVRQGYLDKLHSSAGRVPTTMGLKYFLQELIEELDVIDTVTKARSQQGIHPVRFDRAALMREGLRQLAEMSHNAAVGLVDGQVVYSGLSEMLNIPEFQELNNLRKLMVILEDYSMLSSIFQQRNTDDGVKVLIGEEDTGFETFQNYAVVYAPLRLYRGQTGFISVIGPNRMNYKHIIPAVEFIATTINNAVAGWE